MIMHQSRTVGFDGGDLSYDMRCPFPHDCVVSTAELAAADRVHYHVGQHRTARKPRASVWFHVYLLSTYILLVQAAVRHVSPCARLSSTKEVGGGTLAVPSELDPSPIFVAHLSQSEMLATRLRPCMMISIFKSVHTRSTGSRNLSRFEWECKLCIVLISVVAASCKSTFAMQTQTDGT